MTQLRESELANVLMATSVGITISDLRENHGIRLGEVKAMIDAGYARKDPQIKGPVLIKPLKQLFEDSGRC